MPAHACTDITGFGLIGHLAEMIQGTDLALRIDPDRLPIIQESLEFAAMGVVPGGAYKNRNFCESLVQMREDLDPAMQDILFDPQTSGDFCIAVDRSAATGMVDHLLREGVEQAAIIGEVADAPAGIIQVR